MNAKHPKPLTSVVPEEPAPVKTGAGTRTPLRDAEIDEAVEVLRNGGVAAIPTDTVYGLAAHGLDPAAVARVFEAKGRPPGMALPLLLSDVHDLPLCCVDVPASARWLADAFWPGSLTLVLRRTDAVPDTVTAGGDTVAVRVPDHPVPREVARRLGSPITGTSANRSGLPPATTAAEVRDQLGGRVDYVLDGGPARSGVPSTVLDLTGPEPVIVRPGAVSAGAIAEALGTPVEIPTGL